MLQTAGAAAHLSPGNAAEADAEMASSVSTSALLKRQVREPPRMLLHASETSELVHVLGAYRHPIKLRMAGTSSARLGTLMDTENLRGQLACTGL